MEDWMVIPMQATVTSSWLSTTQVGQSSGLRPLRIHQPHHFSEITLKLIPPFLSEKHFRSCVTRLKKFSEVVNLRVYRPHRTSFPLTFVNNLQSQSI